MPLAHNQKPGGPTRRGIEDARQVSVIGNGFAIDGFNDLRENDVLEAYRIEKTAAKL